MSKQDEYIKKLQGVLVEEGLGKLRALKAEFSTTLERFPTLGKELQTIIDAGEGVDYDTLVPRVGAQLNQAAKLLARLELLPEEERAVTQMAEFIDKLEAKITLHTVEVWEQEFKQQIASAKEYLKTEAERIRRVKAVAERIRREKEESEQILREKEEAVARLKTAEDEKKRKTLDAKERKRHEDENRQRQLEIAAHKRRKEEIERKIKRADSICTMVAVATFFVVWLGLNQTKNLNGFPGFLIAFAALMAVGFVGGIFVKKIESKSIFSDQITRLSS